MGVKIQVTTSSGNKINVTPKTGKTNIVAARRAVLSSTSVSDKNYVHEQGSPASTWTINHNLGKYPSVSVIDSVSNLILCEVEYTSTNQVVLTFDASTSGKAYMN